MKLPGINVGPLGASHARNLPRPNAKQLGDAIGDLVDTVGGLFERKTDTQLSEATGQAAQELSALRAKLETSRSVESNEIPDDIVHEIGFNIVDASGNVEEIGRPFTFTHEVADEWWSLKSQEIVNAYADQITSDKARAKFVEEMMTRYVAPGTLAINKSSITKRRAHGQAITETGIQQVLASDASTEVREAQAKEMLARQLALGADPLWVSQRLQAIGPRIDQINVQNQLIKATDKDEVDQIVSDMWTHEEENRMSPDQMRTLNVQADKMVHEFEAEKADFQRGNGEEMTARMMQADLAIDEVAKAVANEDISRQVGMVLFNALQSGGTTQASNQFTLSRWRGQIVRLPYTGGEDTVTNRADFLRQSIIFASQGLNPNGTPMATGATVSGTDAATLIREIDAKVRAPFSSQQYTTAAKLVGSSTRAVDPITGALTGNQSNIAAYVQFKQALDSYMDQYGAEADPIAFFNQNRDSFKSENFDAPFAVEFSNAVPEAKQFMVQDGRDLQFDAVAQAQFINWLRGQVQGGTMNRDRAEKIAAQFSMYYRGQGIAPGGDDSLFEAPTEGVQ